MLFLRKMRQVPGLRSRASNASSTGSANLKRLTNGITSKRNGSHVRTRSQASPLTLRKRLSSKCENKVVGYAENSKSSSRSSNRIGVVTKKHINVNGLVSSKCNGARRGPGRPPGSKFNGEERRRLLKEKLKRNEKLRDSRSHEQNLLHQRVLAAKKRTERLNKRRSALWVLNCEAESFLFGETAADKHEVELPPLSSPPSKRRKIRTNELGSLLKETPLLGSKLRAASKSLPKDDDTNSCGFNQFSTNSSDKRCTKEDKDAFNKPPKLLPSPTPTELAKNLDLLNGVEEDDDDILPPYLSREPGNYELSPIASPVSMLSSFSGENSNQNFAEKNTKSHCVRMNGILSALDLKFSFEDLPDDEIWYSTFKRQEELGEGSSYDASKRSNCCSHSHSFTPLLLPYETRVLTQRIPAKKRVGKLPRKSPRCHASTLAILSSLKRVRGRSSLCSPIPPALGSQKVAESPEPGVSADNVSVPSLESTSLDSPTAKVRRVVKKKDITNLSSPLAHSMPQVVCPKPSTLPPVSPPLLSPVSTSSSPSPSSSSSFSNRLRYREMSATQYLWDSIQLLSDPYVIQVLSGEDTKNQLPSPDLKSTYLSTDSIDSNSLLNSFLVDPDPCVASSKTKGPKLTPSSHRKQPSSNMEYGRTTYKSKMSEVIEKNDVVSALLVKSYENNVMDKCNMPPSKSPGSVRKGLGKGKTVKPTMNGITGNILVSSHADKSCWTSNDMGGDKSAILNGIKLKFKNDKSLGIKNRKHTRKSPVVLVSDILKRGSSRLAFLEGQQGRNSQDLNSVINNKCRFTGKQDSPRHTVQNFDLNKIQPNDLNGDGKLKQNEDLLLGLDKIPPLPAWPV